MEAGNVGLPFLSWLAGGNPLHQTVTSLEISAMSLGSDIGMPVMGGDIQNLWFETESFAPKLSDILVM